MSDHIPTLVMIAQSSAHLTNLRTVLRAVYIQLNDGGDYVRHETRTAISHCTRGPAEFLTLKPDTVMLTHLPLGDSGTRLPETLRAQDIEFSKLVNQPVVMHRSSQGSSSALHQRAVKKIFSVKARWINLKT